MSTHTLVLYPRAGDHWQTFEVPNHGRKTRTTLVIPGEHAFIRVLDAPGKTAQQIRAAALAQLAPDLAQDTSSAIIALGERPDGAQLVGVADRATLEGFLAEARAQNWSIDAIIPDTCLLQPMPDTEFTTITIGDDVLVRGPISAFVCQADLLGTLGVTPNAQEGTLIGNATCAFRIGTLPDFLPALPTARATTADAKQPRRIACAMAAALVLAIAAPWTNAIRLDMSARAMERDAQAIAARALPNATQIRNARAQLRAALLAHTNGRQRIETAAVLLGELTALPDISIARLDADADAPLVRANLTAATPDAAAPLRDRLAARNYTAEQTASDTDNGLSAIDLTVRPSP